MSLFQRPPKISWLLLFMLLFSSQPAQAQDDGIEMSVRVGFDGYYKEEYWVPVQVEVANSGPNTAGEIQVLTGDVFTEQEIVYSAPLTLSTQSNKRVTIFVQLGPILDGLKVNLVDENGRLLHTITSEPPRNFSLQSRIYGVVSPEPSDFTFLERAVESPGGTAVAFLTLDDLPDLSSAWQALNALVLHDVDTSTLSSAQRTALQNWVSSGGQLVVVGGPSWQKTMPPLADMLPIQPNSSESRADLSEFAEQIGVPFRDEGPYIVTTSALRNGAIIHHEAGLPLVARRSWGRGQVYFLALDPTLAPLVDWDGSDILWQDMGEAQPDILPWGLGVQNQYAATTAVTTLPSLALPSFTALIIFLVVYIGLVGPVNYLILKRLDRRELAWVTIPGIVLLFTVGTYVTGFQLKGNDTIINQMSIVYGHLGSEDEVNAQTLIGLYSPRRTVHDLVMPQNTAVQPIGDGFSTVDNRFDSISRSLNTTINGIRTDVGGIKTYLADSTLAPPAVVGEATLALDEGQLNLSIFVQNNGDVDLEKAALLFGETIIPLGTLTPNETSNTKQQIGRDRTEDIGLPVLTPERGPRSPLAANPEILLGTGDFYNDPEAFPRWQILQALDTSNRVFLDATLATDAVTLVAWTKEPQLELELAGEAFETLATTLYLLDIPVVSTAISGQNQTVPFSFVNVDVVDSDGVFEPGFQSLFLDGGSVDFEYRPRGEFADIAVTNLNVVVTSQTAGEGQPIPDIQLWDWALEAWVLVEGVEWGETAVSNPTSFVNDNNTVRLRIEDTSLLGTDIDEVYVVFTGDLE
ncbi:MAG: hypothetical protein AAF614_01115 [Chloroflexota bacterium]